MPGQCLAGRGQLPENSGKFVLLLRRVNVAMIICSDAAKRSKGSKKNVFINAPIQGKLKAKVFFEMLISAIPRPVYKTANVANETSIWQLQISTPYGLIKGSRSRFSPAVNR
jgi:hypothetical protein